MSEQATPGTRGHGRRPGRSGPVTWAVPFLLGVVVTALAAWAITRSSRPSAPGRAVSPAEAPAVSDSAPIPEGAPAPDSGTRDAAPPEAAAPAPSVRPGAEPDLAAAPDASAPGAAAPFVHEPFDYAGGHLVGNEGGTGWGAPWRDSPGKVTTGTSLWCRAADAVAAAGGHYSCTNDNWKATRRLAAPLGREEGTVWLAFLIRNDTGEQKETYGFLGLTDEADKGVKFGQSHWSDRWGLLGPKEVKSPVPSNNKDAMLVVARLDFGAGEGRDAVAVYVNPDAREEPKAATVECAGVDLGAPDRIVLQSGTSGKPFSFDEIRIGGSYAAVVPTAAGGRAEDARAAVEGAVDWARSLSIDDVRSDSGWVVSPGGADRVRFAVRNAAAVAWKGTARIELCDADGRVVAPREKRIDLPPGGKATVEEDLSFAGRGAGEHLVRVRLLRGPRDDRRQDAGIERSLAVAGPEHAFILFEKEPVSRGLEFVRRNVGPAQVATGGLRRWIWRAYWKSSEIGWWRSVRMNFTDDAFRNGAAPVVDVDIRFRQPAEAPVNVSADRRAGNGAVASGWGGRGAGYVRDPPMKRLFARIDDAVFGRTVREGEQGENPAQGCDIRYNACTADGEIRSVFVRRYDLERDVDWSRLLRPKGVDLGRTNFVFEPGTRVPAKVKLANAARVPYRERAKVRLSTAYDRLLWEKALPVDIPPESEGALGIPIETKGRPYGVYVLRTAVGEHVTTETLFALSDTAPLPKAKEGEFLYGTDVGGTYGEKHKLDWAEFMGMDIVRNCTRGGGQTDRKALTAAIAELERRGLRGHIMMDPAWHADPAERAKRNAAKVEFLSWAAETHGEFLYWYELGNEPDLPFFYAGPIDAYVEGYKPMYRAIKAKDPASVVMNGGLCFHGQDGLRRAHELVEKLPGDMVDAWAYHGHGPGAAAERNAWNRQDKAVRAVGKGGRDYIETESGLFANDPSTWRRQAQTIVEKVVFAQSKGAPTFFWFNLHMGGGDWGYTTVERENEPRPAVLAHRTMVKCLKGLEHSGVLDLAAPEAEAHLFAAPDGRRAACLWSDRGEIARTISVGPGCRDARRVDLYGNAAPADEAALGLLQVSVDADPVFLTWRAGESDHKVIVPPPPLALPGKLCVVPGRRARLPVTVRNPTGSELRTSLRFTTVGAAPVKVAAAVPAIRVPARGELSVTVDVEVEAVEPSLWPRQWAVFIPVPGEVDLATFDRVPTEIRSRGRVVRPRVGIPDGADLDLGRLNKGFAEKKQALCFAWVESAAEREVEIGAAADWWMEWYVNGRRVYSTMDRGNKAPYEVLAHVFRARLREGRNLVAVRVLSGSAGWRLVSGGPDEVAAARRERRGERDSLRVELMAGDRLLAREPVTVEVLRPVERLEGAADWTRLAPDGQLGAVTNLFVAQPDQSKWHQGADDLSGDVWLRERGGALVVAVLVRDDVHRGGDGCRIRIATGAELGPAEPVRASARRDDAAGTTLYEAAIERARIGADRFAIQVRVEDDDWGAPPRGGELKQHASWGAGDDPERWFQSWLR